MITALSAVMSGCALQPHYSIAEDAAIAATRDHVQAWIALMKAIGAVTPPLQNSN